MGAPESGPRCAGTTGLSGLRGHLHARVEARAEGCGAHSLIHSEADVRGDAGPRTLCNACGLVYAKMAGLPRRPVLGPADILMLSVKKAEPGARCSRTRRVGR
jgi:hypothetical protein